MAARMLTLRQPASDADWTTARALIERYAQLLAVDLSFQDFAKELDALPYEYGPPTGAFFLAFERDSPVGCVGLRRVSATVAEIKRLFTVPEYRGFGVGRQLAERIIQAGRTLGYSRLLLDTLPTMTEAQDLYESLGFRHTEPYRFNPIAGTVFLALDL